jgi:hypothetical protein
MGAGDVGGTTRHREAEMNRSRRCLGIPLLAVGLAFIAASLQADDDQLNREEFLAGFRAVLEEQRLDPLDGWAPGAVDGVIELLGRRLEKSGNRPTARQLEDLCAFRRRQPGRYMIHIWQHPLSRRRTTAQLVYEVEEFLLSEPVDPDQRRAAQAQAEGLINTWSDELAEREPELAARVRRDAERLYAMFVKVDEGEAASPEWTRPAPEPVIEECNRLWQAELGEREQGHKRSPLDHMLTALSPLKSAARRRTLPPIQKCEDYAAYVDMQAFQATSSEVSIWEERARLRTFALVQLRGMVSGAPQHLPIPPGTVYGNAFSQAAELLVEPFEEALFRWDARAMAALLEEEPGLEEPYEVRWMQARLARALYVDARSRSAADVSELGERCVRTARSAFGAAPGPFERACVAADILPLRACLAEDGLDVTRLLGGTLKAITAQQSVQEGIDPDEFPYWKKHRPAGWAAQLALAQPMEPGPADVNAPRPKRVAQLITEELRRIAYVDYPWHVAVKVWEDLPPFLDAWLPEDAANRIEELRPSIRWYLWVAVTQHLPTPAEQKVIKAQVDELAGVVSVALNRAAGKRDDDEFGAAYGLRLRQSYARTRDNCLFPYWKRALLPHEMAALRGRLEEAGEAEQIEGQAPEHQWDALYSKLLALVVEHGAPGVCRMMPDGTACEARGVLSRRDDLVFYVTKEGGAEE